MTVRPGTVYLVGAGPGDPSLITVRGLDLLRRADVVLHDRLVDPALLDEAPLTALIVDVGKTPGDAETIQQTVINDLLVRHAKSAKVVVRLKGGDPFLFGRGWEEARACRQADVPCEVIPGVSSALAAPAAAGVPVTLRGVSATVAIAAAPVTDDERLRRIAGADTCIFLMGMQNLRDLARRLVSAGRDPDTPVAVIERATMPGERQVRARLCDIADVAEAAALSSPAVIVVGVTAGFETRTARPLDGRRIVVTRPRNAAHESVTALRALGAHVTSLPLIRPESLPSAEVVPFTDLDSFDWLTFTSRHAVRGFRRLVECRGMDVRAIAHARVAAIGPVTARELAVWGIRADLEPEPCRADALVTALAARRPRRVLFPCGTLALDTVSNGLSARGIMVERLVVYRTVSLIPDERSRQAMEKGVDAILLASPSAAVALGTAGIDLAHARVICIGPTTAAAASRYAWPDILVADVHSDAGLVAATLAALAPGVRA